MFFFSPFSLLVLRFRLFGIETMSLVSLFFPLLNANVLYRFTFLFIFLSKMTEQRTTVET